MNHRRRVRVPLSSRLIGLTVFLVLLPFTSLAALDLTIQVPGELTSASSLGLQERLNLIARSGGGTLTLTGAGSLLVDVRRSSRHGKVRAVQLQLGNGVRLRGDGDAHEGGYGMTIVGSPDDGASFRTIPIVSLDRSQSAAVDNILFEGDRAGYILCAAAIAAYGSKGAIVTHVSIQGSRRFGIAAKAASYLTIQDLDVILKRATPGSAEPEGGAGVWCAECDHAILDSSRIYSYDYYNSGPPGNSGDPRVGVQTAPETADPIQPPYNAPAIDLVAFYDGSNNAIRRCHIGYGNSAGIFLAKDTGRGETGDLVWDNTIDHVRQNGLDIASCENCVILANTVTNCDLSDLLLAFTTNARVEHNTLDTSGRWPNTWMDSGNLHGAGIGSLELLGNAIGSQIGANTIRASYSQYAIWFWYYQGVPASNTVTANQMWRNGAHSCIGSGGDAPHKWQSDNRAADSTFCH